MSLRYCWPSRALNNFCVTQSINLPSLCGWKHCQRGAPEPKVNSGLAAASSSGKHHSNGPGKGQTQGSLRTCQGWPKEAEGVASSPYGATPYEVTPARHKPEEPACLGWEQEANMWKGAGRLDGIPLPCTSLYTPRSLTGLFLLQ